MNQKVKRVLIVLILVILVGVIIFFVGKSFGFFQYVRKGETVNIIAINGIDVEILNKDKNNLNLENAYPMYESEGLAQTPFEFTMTNTSSRALNYSIKISVDQDKLDACTTEVTKEDGSLEKIKCQELSTGSIKVSYKKDDGTYSKAQLLSQDNGVIATGVIEGKGVVKNSIVLWIDEDSGNEIMNHYFFGKIIIEGTKAE